MDEHHNIDEADAKIARLREVILGIQRAASSQTGQERRNTEAILEMLQNIETRCLEILDGAVAFRDSMRSTVKAMREQEIGNPGELGGLVGEMGEDVVKNAMNSEGVATILEKSIPIAGSVLATASDFADVVERNATEAANAVLNAVDKTREIIDETAQNTSNALVGQTANLSTSLTQTTESTIDGILGSVRDVADEMKKDILNPSTGDGVDKMVQTTIEKTPEMVSKAQEKSRQMSTNVRPEAERILRDAPTICQGMVNQTVDTIGGWIGNGPACAVRDYMLYGNEPTYVGEYNGLFKNQALLAAADINAGGNAIGATIGLVNKMAQGLSTLGDFIFGNASHLSSDMAQAGMKAAQQLTSTSGDVSGTLSNSIPPIQQSMLKTSATVGQNLLSGIGNIASALANGDSSKISAAAGEVFSGLQKFTGQQGLTKGIASAVLSSTTGLSGGMLDMASSLTSGLVKSAVDKINDMFNKSEQNGQDANATAQSNSDSIESAIGEVSKEWNSNNWAKDWMDKAAEGIKGLVDSDSVLDKLGNKLSSLIKGLKGKKKKDEKNGEDQNNPSGQNSPTTTPMNQTSPQDSAWEQMSNKNKKSPTFGWESFAAEMTEGLTMMMHDGDQ